MGDAASGPYPPSSKAAMAYAHSREQSATMVPLIPMADSAHLRNNSGGSMDGRVNDSAGSSSQGPIIAGAAVSSLNTSSTGSPVSGNGGKGRRTGSSGLVSPPPPPHAQQPSSSRLPPGLPAEWSVEPSIVIQHRDAGMPVVHEIPPPYFGREGHMGSQAGVDARPTASTGNYVYSPQEPMEMRGIPTHSHTSIHEPEADSTPPPLPEKDHSHALV